MITLYNLILIDNELSEQFDIGIFSEFELAEKTAAEYLTYIRGFNEYDCGYQINEKIPADRTDGDVPEKVYIICGWNENELSDPTDIIESDCYSSEAAARQALIDMKTRFRRTEWSLDCCIVNERKWKDGFVRV